MFVSPWPSTNPIAAASPVAPIAGFLSTTTEWFATPALLKSSVTVSVSPYLIVASVGYNVSGRLTIGVYSFSPFVPITNAEASVCVRLSSSIVISKSSVALSFVPAVSNIYRRSRYDPSINLIDTLTGLFSPTSADWYSAEILREPSSSSVICSYVVSTGSESFL